MAVRGAAARRAEPCTRDSRGSHRVPADSGRYPSGQRGQTVNLLAYAFGGSNPPLPTISVDAHVTRRGGKNSAGERPPSKLGGAGSNPRFRPRSFWLAPFFVHRLALSAERVLREEEGSRSIPDMASTS